MSDSSLPGSEARCDSVFYPRDGRGRSSCALEAGHAGMHESHSKRMGYIWRRWTDEDALDSLHNGAEDRPPYTDHGHGHITVGRERPLAPDFKDSAEAAAEYVDTPSRVSPSATPRESRSEIKRRVTMQGGTMDEAFDEIKRVESPSRGSEEELGELLDAFRSACREPHGTLDEEEHEMFIARSAVESYVSRLRDERREEIERLEYEKECLLKAHAWLKDQYIRLEAALATLKEQQRGISESTLTEDIRIKEARLSCAVEAGAYGPIIDAWTKELDELRAKLRLLSTSDSEQK